MVKQVAMTRRVAWTNWAGRAASGTQDRVRGRAEERQLGEVRSTWGRSWRVKAVLDPRRRSARPEHVSCMPTVRRNSHERERKERRVETSGCQSQAESARQHLYRVGLVEGLKLSGLKS